MGRDAVNSSTTRLLDALCVRGTPAEAGRDLRQRFAGIADRVSLSVPYRIAPDDAGRTRGRLSSRVTS